ncbi:MAG: SUMF1/EgtB/PvdO family nonheme iron enzyme [Anaerolineae bacterium]|nr:SUMF1/EgtB/PvdO family nonheme iron enzyme [Anaerolineae bacterium]
MKRLVLISLVISLLLVPAAFAQDNGGSPDMAITWPPPVYTLRGAIPVLGTANVDGMGGYAVEVIALPDGELVPGEATMAAAWTMLGSFGAAEGGVQDAELVRWDTTTVPDGLYALRLNVFTPEGFKYAVVSPLRVENNPPDFITVEAPAETAAPAVAGLPAEPLPVGYPNADWVPIERDANGVPVVLVPAGCFMMGSEEGRSDELPVHEVCVDTFWIGKTEVTNAQYGECVNAGFCTPPEYIYSYNRDEYFGNPEFANYPVIEISWRQARAYAEWLGGSLPTEAEWEYAARGPESWPYPWGSEEPTSAIVNYDFNVGDTSLAGMFPKNASWVGAVDMAGNVAEWTNSLYRDYPYDAADGRELTDPSIDANRVLRGGHYQTDTAYGLTSSRRADDEPDYASSVTGFRVVVYDIDNLPPLEYPAYEEAAAEEAE